MKNEFTLAFNEVLEEKQLPKEIILKALESAMVSAYRRAVNASSAQNVEAKIDPDTGKVQIFAEKEVVDSVQDTRTEVTLSEARRYAPDAEIGSMVVVESTPHDFGRVAAQTARQVIQQRIRDAERSAQKAFYEKQLGEIVSGIVQAINSQGLSIGMEMRAEGNMARKDMIPGERFRLHDRVRALVAEVKDSPRGPQIVLSRTHRDFLRRLLENEVPEIYHGVVEIRSIAREPGERAKVAVSATQAGIDPVGACVGIRGVRIQAIVRELHDEKIDVIEWNPDPAVFIAKAISPAKASGVYLNERSASGKTATVVVPEDHLSLAIGRDGQNARLAAKLTNWRIDIKSLNEAAADELYKVQHDPLLESFAQDQELISQIEGLLAKKAEGRALSSDENDHLMHFVDRVERRTAAHLAPEKKQVEELFEAELRKSIPEDAFEKNILDSGLPDHVANLLQEAGYFTVGELALRMKTHPDDILKLQGIGPKAMLEINRLMDTLAITAVGLPAEEAAPVLPVETVSPVETAPVAVEEIPAPTPEAEVTAPVEVAVPSETVEVEPVEVAVSEPEVEEEVSFDELFALKPDMLEAEVAEEEEVEGEGAKVDDTTKKKKKKKRKSVEIEYDPERDVVLSKKKHKRGDGWEWES
ncbi:MAG TPA: transcription termination factor NusA [Anaerolineaceae bacterium]|nr:transcription termination factor NusA [Anaerolineaceae bacterium]